MLLERRNLKLQGEFSIIYKLTMGILNILGKGCFKEGSYHRVLCFKLNIYNPLHVWIQNRFNQILISSSRLISHLCCPQDIIEGKVNNSPELGNENFPPFKEIIQGNVFGPSTTGLLALIFWPNLPFTGFSFPWTNSHTLSSLRCFYEASPFAYLWLFLPFFSFFINVGTNLW